MKKILSLVALILISTMSFAASITATDVDFGIVSIKGQQLPVTGSQTITVTFSGLATEGYTMTASVVEGLLDEDSQPSGFYVSPASQYLGYGVGSGTVEFTVSFSVKSAGTFNGKLEFSCYDQSYNEIKGYANLTITVTDGAIVAKTIPFERINTTSELKDGDTIVFVNESAEAVCGSLYTTYLPAITENVTVDKSAGKANVPETAQMFTAMKYSDNWQFTTIDTQKRLHLDVTGKGAFTYEATVANEILANWGVSISNGVATVSRPDDGTFPVEFNVDRFKPYKNTAGSAIALYKKNGAAQEVESSLTIATATIDFDDVALSATKKIEINYTAKNLTDDIIWIIEGSDAALFDVADEGNRNSGTVTVTYKGTGSKAGGANAKLSYLTEDIQMDEMSGSFPISINLIELNSISFKQTSYDLLKNEQKDMSAELVFSPADVPNKGIEWKFNKSYYNATISDAGVFKATATGEYVIIATSVLGENIQARCTVNVSLPVPESVELDATELTMNIGDKKTLTATIHPDGTEKSTEFASDNESVASVNKNGLITAKTIGTAVITVSVKDYPDVKNTCKVTVTKATVESISLPTEASITLGSSLQLEPVVTPQQAATDHGVNYASDNEAVATVSESGLVSSIAEGDAVITVSCDDKSAQITIHVVAPALFAKAASAGTLGAGDTIILAGKVTISDVLTPIVAGVVGASNNLTVVTAGVTLNDEAAYADDALRLVVGGTKDKYTLTEVDSNNMLASSDGTKLGYSSSKNNTWKFEDSGTGIVIANTAYSGKNICYNSQSKYIRMYVPGTNSTVLVVFVRKGVVPGTHTGVDAAEATVTVQKIIREGQLLIIRNGKTYTVTGEEL